MNKDISVIWILKELECTDDISPVSLDRLQSILTVHGVRESKDEIRKDIDIIRRSGKNIIEGPNGYWLKS